MLFRSDNFAAQTTPALQPFLGTGADRFIHPIAGFALARTFQDDALQFKLDSAQHVQIKAFDQEIAPQNRRRQLGLPAFIAQRVKYFPGKQGHLPLIIFLKIKKTVAAKTTTRHAFHMLHLNDRMLTRRLIMMTEIIVTGGNEDVSQTRHDYENRYPSSQLQRA